MKLIAGTALAGLLMMSAHLAAQSCTLIVHVDGFRNNVGDAGAALYSKPDGWPEGTDSALKHGPFPIADNKATVKFDGLPPGKYVFVVIHDENMNHKMDKNMFGYPKEGFGFGNNPHVGMSAPSFDTASLNVSCPTTEATVHMQYK